MVLSSSPSRPPWPALAAAILLMLGIGLAELAVHMERQHREAVARQRTLAVAARLRATLESELNSTLHLSTGLGAYLRADGGLVEPRELQAFLAGLFRHGRYLRNIGIAPGNRITHIYPLAGNEKALGLHYPDMPSQWPAVERAIRERQPNLAGPLTLVQGGSGLIYRIPVFRDDGSYWGLVSTVVDAERLIQSAIAATAEEDLLVALRGKDGLGSEGAVFWGDGRLFAGDATVMDIAIPNGSWQLAVRQQDDGATEARLAALRLAGWLVSAVIAFLAYLAAGAYLKAKHLAISLRQSEDRYRETFEALNDGMWHWDLLTDELTWDQRCYRILGYEPCSASMSREAWLRRLNPADAPATLATVQEKIAGGERFLVEHRLRTRDGRWLWVAMRGRVVSWDGKRPLRVAGTLSDISVAKEAELALRTSELRVRSLIDAMTDLVFVIDTSGRFTEFHPPMDTRDRYPAPADILGEHYDQVLPAGAAVAIREALTGIFIDNRPRPLMLALNTRDGQRSYRATISCLSDGGEWPLGFLCVARDVTEDKRAGDQGAAAAPETGP